MWPRSNCVRLDHFVRRLATSLSSTVMTPSFPTLSIASATCLPIFLSLLAESWRRTDLFLILDRLGHRLDLGHDGVDFLSSAALHGNRIAAGGQGTTPLYDATLGALDAIQPARGRRALVLLSDGTDRYSDATAADLVDRARTHDVLIYPVAVGSARPPVFAELAAATGGRSFFVRDPRALITTMTTIARELRFQYLLGYVPSRARSTEASWHAIDVTVERPDVRVRARDGYMSR